MSSLEENQSPNDNRILGYQSNGKPSAATPTLQFNATTKSFDWVASSSSMAGGDISYLAGKEFLNVIRKSQGTLSNATGVIVTLTANVGKDMYLGIASISAEHTGIGTVVAFEADLRINSVVVESLRFRVPTITDTNASIDTKFKITGLKVTTGQVIDINIVSQTQAIIDCSLECFETDTGVSPNT